MNKKLLTRGTLPGFVIHALKKEISARAQGIINPILLNVFSF